MEIGQNVEPRKLPTLHAFPEFFLMKLPQKKWTGNVFWLIRAKHFGCRGRVLFLWFIRCLFLLVKLQPFHRGFRRKKKIRRAPTVGTTRAPAILPFASRTTRQRPTDEPPTRQLRAWDLLSWRAVKLRVCARASQLFVGEGQFFKNIHPKNFTTTRLVKVSTFTRRSQSHGTVGGRVW